MAYANLICALLRCSRCVPTYSVLQNVSRWRAQFGWVTRMVCCGNGHGDGKMRRAILFMGVMWMVNVQLLTLRPCILTGHIS